MWYNVNSIEVWINRLLVALTLGWIKGFLYVILLPQSVLFCSIFDLSTQPSWLKETMNTHIMPFFVISSNSYTRILDSYWPSYASMTVHIIDGISYDTSKTLTRTLSCIKVSLIMNIIHMLPLYNLVTLFIRWPVSRTATVLAFYWVPCLNLSILLSIHTAVMDCYWLFLSTSISGLNDCCAAILQGLKLIYSMYEYNPPSFSATGRLESRYHIQSCHDIVYGWL